MPSTQFYTAPPPPVNPLARAFDTDIPNIIMRAIDRKWRAEQATLDREAKEAAQQKDIDAAIDMQSSAQTHSSSENRLDREFKTGLQTNEQVFRQGESKKGREHDFERMDEEFGHIKAQSAIDQAAQEKMQEGRFKHDKTLREWGVLDKFIQNTALPLLLTRPPQDRAKGMTAITGMINTLAGPYGVQVKDEQASAHYGKAVNAEPLVETPTTFFNNKNANRVKEQKKAIKNQGLAKPNNPLFPFASSFQDAVEGLPQAALPGDLKRSEQNHQTNLRVYEQMTSAYNEWHTENYKGNGSWVGNNKDQEETNQVWQTRIKEAQKALGL